MLEKDKSAIERTAFLFQQQGIDCTVAQCRLARQSYLRDLAFGKAAGSIHPQTKQEILTFYRELLRRMGHTQVNREVAYSIYLAYGEMPTYLFEDVRPLFQALTQLGVTIGILSNHSATTRPVIEQMVGQYVATRHIVISEEERVHKPSKTIFQRTAVRLKADPQECVYVGDNLYVDAIGAVQNGRYGYGLWLDRAGCGVMHDLPTNVVRISHLQQVLDFVPQ
jgi:HAD superfamily hydrolase (TIGR01549 family)